MFERYTEGARRVIFFARYEAAVLGSPSIDSEHLLLGLLREGGGPAAGLLRRRGITHEGVLGQVRKESPAGEVPSTAVDIPLTEDAKRALADASAEAEGLDTPHIGTEHVLLGLLRHAECSASRILVGQGLSLEDVRAELRVLAQAEAPAGPARAFPALVEFLARLDERGAAYQVSRLGDGVSVDVVVSDERWVATFLTDGRVAVEVFAVSARDQGEPALARLLDRLGPPR